MKILHIIPKLLLILLTPHDEHFVCLLQSTEVASGCGIIKFLFIASLLAFSKGGSKGL